MLLVECFDADEIWVLIGSGIHGLSVALEN